MTDTINLGLPCIEGSQAQKHVTHNDALRILDTLVQLAVLDRDLTAPPASPAEGQRWIVKTGATGLWAGHANAIAAWQDGGWQYSVPQIGWVAFVADEGTLVVWSGTAWGDFFSTITSIQNLALLGLGTTADASNPLSAKLNNALFAAKTVAEGGDGHLRYKLNKESAAKTLSFLFQDNWSGRAEIGLTGDDDFHFKVSPDGSTWYEGIVISRSTGAVTFPNTTISDGREKLNANRTYYVRTDGNDSNNGLSNAAGGAFLTIQKAIDVAIGTLDAGSYNVTIQIGAGTYPDGVIISGRMIGSGTLTLLGDVATPSNVVINRMGGHAIYATSGARVSLSGLKLATTTSGICIYCDGNSFVTLADSMEFGATPSRHMYAANGRIVANAISYTISGNATSHMEVTQCGSMVVAGCTISILGTPAFSVAFANSNACGAMIATGNSYIGTATGIRYSAALNGAINTGSGSGTYFPGNSAGSTATGGQYA